MEKSNYLVLVYKVRVWIIMFEIEAFAGLRIRSVLMYSTGSKAKNNENIGHYGQTLFSACPKSKRSDIMDKLNFTKSLKNCFNLF